MKMEMNEKLERKRERERERERKGGRKGVDVMVMMLIGFSIPSLVEENVLLVESIVTRVYGLRCGLL